MNTKNISGAYQRFQELIVGIETKYNLTSQELAKSLDVPVILIEGIKAGRADLDITNSIIFKVQDVFNIKVFEVIREENTISRLLERIAQLATELELKTLELAKANLAIESLKKQNELQEQLLKAREENDSLRNQ